MTKRWNHERAYRGDQGLAKLAELHVTIAGVGALGSLISENLGRQGFQNLRLIDRDRVEETNLGTQVFGVDDIGMPKVEAAQNHLFRNVEIEAEAINKELCDGNVHRLLKKTDLVIDAMDNNAARQSIHQFCSQHRRPCLHVGMYEDYGEVVWDATYRVPEDADLDPCDYPLARNLILLVVSVACEEVVNFAMAEKPRLQSWSITLKDLAITHY